MNLIIDIEQVIPLRFGKVSTVILAHPRFAVVPTILIPLIKILTISWLLYIL